MEHIGIDVHKKDSQICILAEGGELIEERDPLRARALRGCARGAAPGADRARGLDRE